jgi:c-di-GMP-binding flagellar brake protein YcgR
MSQSFSISRRLSARVETPDGVWVYWRSNGRDDLSRVHDLSTGGLFIETSTPRITNTKITVDFLVQEGQIRAEAVVRHVKPGRGLGLRFTAVPDADRRHLAALVTRLRDLARLPMNTHLRAQRSDLRRP